MASRNVPAGVGKPTEDVDLKAVAIDSIVVGQRLRQLDGRAVADLMMSILEVGLQSPISIRVPVDARNEDGTINWGSPVLVAGLHRLEACRRLGWSEIPAFVVRGGDEIDCQLREIAENLHRAELTALERAKHIGRWVVLVGQKAGQLAHPGARQPHDKGISAASRELGIERTEVRRAVKIDGLSDDAKDAALETGLDDNQSALLRAAAKPAEEQAEAIREEAAARERRPSALEELLLGSEQLPEVKLPPGVLKEKRRKERERGEAGVWSFASWLMEHAEPDEIRPIISWLRHAPPKAVVKLIETKLRLGYPVGRPFRR